MSEQDKTPLKKKRRAEIYTGEGYIPPQNVNRQRAKTQSPENRESAQNIQKKRQPLKQGGAEQKRENAARGSVLQETKKAASAEKQPAWQEKLRARRRRRRIKILCCSGGILAAVYIAAAVYFGFHFYGETFIFGIDCSRRTVEQVKLDIADKLDDYVLEIQEREGKTEFLTAAEIGLEFVDDSSIDRMMKAQRSYLWPVMLLLERGSVDSVAFTYDKGQVETELNSLECMDSVRAVAPQDAYIGVTDTGFEVVSEVMGTLLNKDRTKEVILAALDAGAVSVSLEDEGCYIDPEIYHDNEELIRDAAAMSQLARANITYDFGNQQEVVNAPVIKDWIVELADGSFVIDDICVTDYVESLAAKYDTFGLPLDFYTSLGTTVTLSGGDYGWCIDQSATIVALLNALEEGYQGTMEPVYLYTAMSHENQGIGYTYVEICISQQRMWCYENGNVIVDTPVVTGNPNKGNGTPSGGVWAIDAKERNAILTGEGYSAPVDYWMPFNGDVGIHDMQQRAYFGGTIYLTNGSHGCVNTPYDQVKIIYEAVSVGTPVIVYE